MEAAKEKSKSETASRELHSEMNQHRTYNGLLHLLCDGKSDQREQQTMRTQKENLCTHKTKDWPADKPRGRNKEFNQQIKSVIRHEGAAHKNFRSGQKNRSKRQELD
jgi:hypothetical protein